MPKSSEPSILSTAPKAIAHLRAQLERKRLGLIFGAGISKDLGFPNWIELVNRIASHSNVDAVTLLDRFQKQGSPAHPITRSLASVTQMLFSHFRSNQIKKQSLTTPLTFMQEQSIKTGWLKIIHHELYKDLSRDERSVRIDKHPYLKSFLSIIKRSPLTVNYNFDDTLERMLLSARDSGDVDKTRGYEVSDRPNNQFQKDHSVIYHPNGFLPSIFEDGASPEVVFSDDAFQDQIISAATGKYLHLTNHLFRNTCLLIGLSLEDATLQSLLRQNAVTSPGNVHYVVQYTPTDTRDEESEAAVFKANFESYNLYTLFLDSPGVKNLADIIELPRDSFKLNHGGKKTTKFVYYIIGSVGSGKSTAAANFRNLITYDEWIDERKPALAMPEDEVAAEEVDEINSWIAEQFRKKNFALLDSSEGVHIVDRAPLDPLTFGTPAERPAKATFLLTRITDENTRKIAAGHIIHLDCDIDQVRIRNSLKHKYWPDAEYERLLAAISEIYGNLQRSIICTRGRNAAAVAKEIAKVIFLEDYRPVDLDAMLKKIAES